MRVACLLPAALPPAMFHAAVRHAPCCSAPPRPKQPPTTSQSAAAQARTLLETPQGAALLDLLGDPAVRQQLLAAPPAPAPHAAPTTGSMGRTLDHILSNTRQRIIDLATQLRVLPAALIACWDRMSAGMPASGRLEILFYLIAFVAGGIAAQRLFHLLASRQLADAFQPPERRHAGAKAARACWSSALRVQHRLLGTLAAGNAGHVHAVRPARLQRLDRPWATSRLASLVIRLSHTVSPRFHRARRWAPAPEVPISTPKRVVLHRWAQVLAALPRWAGSERSVVRWPRPAARQSGAAVADRACWHSRCTAS